MAKQKKIGKYELTVKVPVNGQEYKMMGKYNDLQELLRLEGEARAKAGEGWDRYSNIRRALMEGTITTNDWEDKVGGWVKRNLRNGAWPVTPECAAVNAAFLAEYDSRPDLQELYQKFSTSNYWLHNLYGATLKNDDVIANGWDKRPESYRMFMDVYENHSARELREKARETPYLEGDLVMLREPFVGKRQADPLWINPYSQAAYAGASTPDKSVPRIATVIGVTDEVNGWRAGKGSKILKVIWMGSEDVVNVEERFVKWHCRPTYKNGLKSRPTE